MPICQRRLGLCHVVGMMVGEDDDNAPQELQPALAWQPARRSFNNKYLSNLTRHLDILIPHHRIQTGVRISRYASDERLRSGSRRCCSPVFFFSTALRCMRIVGHDRHTMGLPLPLRASGFEEFESTQVPVPKHLRHLAWSPLGMLFAFLEF